MLEQVWGLLVPVKGNFNATASKDIIDNCVLPALWQKFGGELYMHGCDGQMSTKLWPYRVSNDMHVQACLVNIHFIT